MYSTIKQYYSFVERLKKEKAIELEMTLNSVRSQMDIYMATAGWQIKGKGKTVSYTKLFNDKPIVIGFRCNLLDSLGGGGLPEFTHDKSIPVRNLTRMTHFRWNDDPTPSGWTLDQVMKEIEDFYTTLTL